MDGFRSTAPARPSLTWDQMKSVEGGVLALDGGSLESLQARLADLKKRLSTLPTTFDTDPHGLRLSTVLPTWSDSILTEGPRLAMVASWAQLAKRLDLALASMMERIDGASWPLKESSSAMAQRPHRPRSPTYPGQGSQWVGMTQRSDVDSQAWERCGSGRTDRGAHPRGAIGGFVLREALDDEESGRMPGRS